MLRTALAVALIGIASPALVAAEGNSPHDLVSRALRSAAPGDRPGIRLWTTHDEVYRRGERARIYFRTERDAFVTVFRVDTDGRVRILYPQSPWDDNFVRGGASYVVSHYRRGEAFVVDDDPGVGYVFGIAAGDPFDYGEISGREQFEVYRVADRIHGDPFGSLMDIVDHLLPSDYAEYDTHLLPYYVERRYDYPRFVCYDCHSYVGFGMWNPYSYSCSRYSMWVYNDPFYYYPSYWYPTRYYGGTRVVYARPRGTTYVGRYVFKGRTQASDPPIVYRRRADVGASSVPVERGVRGRDIGGTGSVPVPGTGRRLVEPRTPAGNPPVIGGGQPRRRDGDQPGGQPNDPGNRPNQPGDRPNQPGDQPGGNDRPGRDDPRNDEPAGRPRGDRDDTPGRRGGDPRNDEPGGQPRDQRPGATVSPESRQAPRVGAPEQGIGERERRGVYRDPAAQPAADRPANDATRGVSRQPEARSEPRREAAPPPQRAEPPRQAEPQRAEPRSEPRQAAPQRSEPPRQAAPQRSEPQRAEPRSQPAPRNEPAPRLERRRPDER